MKLGPQPDWLNARWACRYNPTGDWTVSNECGEPCTLHIRLDDDQGFIAACVEHERFALTMPHIDHHRWGQWCMAPGSLWHSSPTPDEADSFCALDDSGEEPALAAAGQISLSA